LTSKLRTNKQTNTQTNRIPRWLTIRVC